MKKLAFLVLLLVGAGLISAFAITEEEAMAAVERLETLEAKVGTANLAAVISGSATFTFGMDLDTGASGFANATASTIKVTLVATNSQEDGAEEEEQQVYGWIKLTDMGVSIASANTTTATAGAVSARLYLGPLYLNILGIANSVSYATHGQGLAPAFGITTSSVTNVANTFTNEFNGLEIYLPVTGVMNLSVAVASQYDWISAAATDARTVNDSAGNSYTLVPAVAANSANTANVYNFRMAVDLTAVTGLTFGVGANLSTATGSALGLGVKAGYAITLAEEGPVLSLNPQVGFDFTTATGNPWQLGGGLQLKFAGSNRTDVTYFGATQTFVPGLSVGFSTDSSSNMDLNVALFDGDLIPVLNLIALLEMPLTTGANRMGIGARVDADFGVVVPYVNFYYATTASVASNIKLVVGTDIKPGIPNTVFTLTYTSGNLSATPSVAGVITFATKISY